MSTPQGWHLRGYLPHYDDGRSIQSITYRLIDSLPAEVVIKLREQKLDDEAQRVEIENHLDAGWGSCVLREASNAQAVIDTWKYHEGIGYHLHAWVVMPNHVHVLVEPLAGKPIGELIAAWKSVSTRRILAVGSKPGRATVLGRNPPACRPSIRVAVKRQLWQPDYWDRYIRNERHYRAVLEYIHQNPVKAGLVAKAEEWPWSSARKWNEKNIAGSS